MRCDRVEELSAMLDGELSPDRVRLLESHLAQCRECQIARAEFLNLRSQINSFQQTPDFIGTHNRLAQIVGTPNPAQPSYTAGFVRWLRPTPSFAGVAILLMLGFVGLLLYRGLHSQSSGPVQPHQYLAGQGDGPARNATAGIASSLPKTPNPNNKGTVKPGGRAPKTKARPRVETPKPRFNPPELTSPYGSQVIAASNGAADNVDNLHPADTDYLTARHFEQSELLLRSFRNVRDDEARAEISYERQRAQKLVYQNIMLRREADASGDVQVSTLLDSLEPILLDIANLPDRPPYKDVSAIKQRVERKNLVALLQVNSTALARANE